MRNPWGQLDWKGEWAYDSPQWTQDLRDKLLNSDKEDGVFFMTYDEYMRVFKRTCICFKNAPSYTHADFTFSFTPNQLEQKDPAYLTIHLKESIDCEKQTFAISASQQGNRLASYRSSQSDLKFEPARITMLLISANGEIVAVNKGPSRFMQSLVVDKGTLAAG